MNYKITDHDKKKINEFVNKVKQEDEILDSLIKKVADEILENVK